MLPLSDYDQYNNPADLFFIENDDLKIGINQHGAELKTIHNKSTGHQHLWDNKEGFWERTAPNLFPYIARANGGEYIYEGKNYKIPLHGLAPYYTFDVEQRTETAITFSLSANEETLTYYPFDFTFKVHFVLEGKKIAISYEAINNDATKEMVYFIGGHPGFLLNWHKGDTIDNYHLEFSEKETTDRRRVDMEALALDTTFEENFLNNENIIPLKDELFAIDALVFHGLKSKNLSIVRNETGEKITVDISQFPDLGIWNQATVNFVCIEPWHGHGDIVDHNGQIKDKRNPVVLSASESRKHDYSITMF